MEDLQRLLDTISARDLKKIFFLLMVVLLTDTKMYHHAETVKQCFR